MKGARVAKGFTNGSAFSHPQPVVDEFAQRINMLMLCGHIISQVQVK
jgi:hypothetical protein